MSVIINQIDRPRNIIEVGLDFDRLRSSGDGIGRAAVRRFAGPKDETDGDSFGRVNPIDPDEPWLDSMDCTWVTYRTVGVRDRDGNITPYQRLVFAIVDAHDRPPRPEGTDRFKFKVSSAVGQKTFTIKERRANGNIIWLEVLFSAPVKSAGIRVESQHAKDGYSITKARQFSS